MAPLRRFLTMRFVNSGRRRLIGLVGLAFLASLLAWWLWPNAPTPSYRTAAVSRGTVERTILAAGKIRPTRTVEVGAEVSGLISNVHVNVNTPVAAGQVLAEVEPTRLDAAVRQADATILIARGALAEANAVAAREAANVREAEVALQRRSRLADLDLLSPVGLENAQIALLRAEAARDVALAQLQGRSAELQRAQAQREDVRTSRSRARITSPIDGVVIARTVDVGQTIAASFQAPRLFEIATNMTDMRMELAVNEADIADVRLGQTVKFQVEAYVDEVFNGQVVEVQPQASEANNVVTFLVVVAVDNTDGRLKPGMTTTAEIITVSRPNVMRVPAAAVAFQPVGIGMGKPKVERVSIRLSPRLTGGQPTPSRRTTVTNDEGARPVNSPHTVWRPSAAAEFGIVSVPVKLGARGDDWVEIVSGDLNVGDPVVTGMDAARNRR